MADSVLFTGAGPYMHCSVGSAGIDFGPCTIAVCLKPIAAGGPYYMLVTGTSWDNFRLCLDPTNLIMEVGGSSTAYPSPFIVPPYDAWAIVAITKAAGSVAPRFHYYNGTSWVHANGGTAMADQVAATLWELSTNGGDIFQGNMLIFGVANTVFTDPQIEALDDGFAAWVAAGFLEGMRLDATTGNTTFTAGSMAQTAQGGLSLDVGDVPAWWNDTLGPPPQQVDPDADTDVAGWVTAPLYSKLNDGSDSTFITDGLI